jgi:hypothetical protein
MRQTSKGRRSKTEAMPVSFYRASMGRGTVILVLLTLIGCVSTIFAVRAYNRRDNAGATLVPIATPSAAQAGAPRAASLRGRLLLQPEAVKLGRRLGQRFFAPGREVATLVGTLAIGSDRHNIRLVRTQQEDGEQVALALDTGQASLTWNAQDGAISSGRPATGVERSLIERLVLDSPDQFILAQLRGASYYTVAQNVMPSSAGGSDDYDGPLWNVIRLGEPQAAGDNAPLSRWRTFHVNTTTGLIDRIISQEQGETIVAEISGWIDRLGEKVPTHIAWSKNGQTMMELSLNSVAHGPRQ